ncbi:MAG: hypothetical protein ACI89X_003312 [Planctomycetota bacterium]|jgi:hypothetical protein
MSKQLPLLALCAALCAGVGSLMTALVNGATAVPSSPKGVPGLSSANERLAALTAQVADL